MAQEYNYALLTQSIKIPDPDKLQRVDVSELMAKTLGPQAQVISNSVRTLDGGGNAVTLAVRDLAHGEEDEEIQETTQLTDGYV